MVVRKKNSRGEMKVIIGIHVKMWINRPHSRQMKPEFLTEGSFLKVIHVILICIVRIYIAIAVIYIS